MIPSLKEKDVSVVSIASSMGHVAGIHVESEDPDQSSSLGLNLSSMESSPLESEDEATKTDTLLRSSDGVNYGSLSELKSIQTT